MKTNLFRFKQFKLFTRKTVFWSSLTLFIASYIFLTLQTVASGSKYSLLETEVTKLTKENRELNTKIMQSTSLTNINERSEYLGFLRPTKTVYVNGQNPVAKLP